MDIFWKSSEGFFYDLKLFECGGGNAGGFWKAEIDTFPGLRLHSFTMTGRVWSGKGRLPMPASCWSKPVHRNQEKTSSLFRTGSCRCLLLHPLLEGLTPDSIPVLTQLAPISSLCKITLCSRNNSHIPLLPSLAHKKESWCNSVSLSVLRNSADLFLCVNKAHLELRSEPKRRQQIALFLRWCVFSVIEVIPAVSGWIENSPSLLLITQGYMISWLFTFNALQFL